jgi:hypothetical protein
LRRASRDSHALQSKPAAPATKAAAPAAKSAPAKAGAGTGPVVVFETAKGNFEITTYTDDAPKSLAHFMALVNLKTFYQGQRIIWAQSNALGFGDPNSKNMAKKDSWGAGGSGNPVGVEEMSKRKFDKGLVVLYYNKMGGYPAKAGQSS